MSQDDWLASSPVAIRIQILGSVQGIGFRPELARLAQALNLKGSISNSANGVELHLEGTKEDLNAFAHDCTNVCPKRGNIEKLTVCETTFLHFSQLILDPSEATLPLKTHVPKDRNCCDVCNQEVLDERNSRYGYLLNACSDCGPRYTVIESMPFERERTSLSQFKLCEKCTLEFKSFNDRRFHSQGIVCPACGPQLSQLDQCVEQLRSGNVIAIKGIGGYQLIAIAANKGAVEKLRVLKNRPEKPLVVMVSAIEEAKQFADLSQLEQTLLRSDAGPIAILELAVRSDNDVLVHHSQTEAIHQLNSNLNSIGVMLPTTPLHAWLVHNVGALVVTSANVEGDPIIVSDVEMRESDLVRADQIVSHNREIVRHADDSVVRFMANRPVKIRLGRGLVPHVLPWHMQDDGASVLAVGGHQKVAIAFANGHQSILGPHLGDMDGLKSRERFVQHVRGLIKLYGGQPTLIVHDINPDFFTTRWAKEFAIEIGAETLGIQHHHAHLASGVNDAKWWDRSFLGIAWDGTGLGTDGTIWGGEAFLGNVSRLERVASLFPFALPGGEQAIYEPSRIAESLLWETFGELIPIAPLCRNRQVIQQMIASNRYSPKTSSVGRLFDGIAAIIFSSNNSLSPSRVSYEGHWAMLLESLCSKMHVETGDSSPYEVPLISLSPYANNTPPSSGGSLWDWRPMIRRIVDELRMGVSPRVLSFKFHQALAKAIASLGSMSPHLPILLTGGVFQNKVLLELTEQQLNVTGLEWSIPTEVPINDGGLAAGQLLLGLLHLRGERCA